MLQMVLQYMTYQICTQAIATVLIHLKGLKTAHIHSSHEVLMYIKSKLLIPAKLLKCS